MRDWQRQHLYVPGTGRQYLGTSMRQIIPDSIGDVADDRRLVIKESKEAVPS